MARGMRESALADGGVAGIYDGRTPHSAHRAPRKQRPIGKSRGRSVGSTSPIEKRKGYGEGGSTKLSDGHRERMRFKDRASPWCKTPTTPLGEWRGSWKDERILRGLGGCVFREPVRLTPRRGERNSIDAVTTTGQIRHEIRVVRKLDTASRAVWYLRRSKKKKHFNAKVAKTRKGKPGANRNGTETTGVRKVRKDFLGGRFGRMQCS